MVISATCNLEVLNWKLFDSASDYYLLVILCRLEQYNVSTFVIVF